MVFNRVRHPFFFKTVSYKMGRGNPLPFGGGRKRPNLLSTLLCNVFFYRTRRRISDTANKIAIGLENMMFPVMRLKKPFMGSP